MIANHRLNGGASATDRIPHLKLCKMREACTADCKTRFVPTARNCSLPETQSDYQLIAAIGAGFRFQATLVR
ncbi:MAG: hypothetical protein ACJA1G_001951 [Qipengyuania sp.]|jgi:hypothetical protein